MALACGLVVLAGPARADEPPLVGQPDGFSGAVGQRFTVEALAEPTEVQAEEAIRFRLRIASVGPVQRPPLRPDLRKRANFTASFHIRDTAEDRTSELPSGGQRWEFAYSLRPKGTATESIPPVRFVYYTPARPPRARGYFQTTYSRAVPLVVRVPSPSATVPPSLPAEIYRIAEGHLLYGEEPAALPGLLGLGLLAIIPPALCCVWYAIWRRLYPDAALAARRRRSQAARQALQSLRGSRGEGADAQAKRAATAMSTYLCQRLEISHPEATPVETGVQLCRLGFSAPLSNRVAQLFRECDMARFGGGVSGSDDFAAVAEKLILTLESESWHSPLP